MRLKDKGIRLALFRKGGSFFECYVSEEDAIAALNFVRFLD